MTVPDHIMNQLPPDDRRPQKFPCRLYGENGCDYQYDYVPILGTKRWRVAGTDYMDHLKAIHPDHHAGDRYFTPEAIRRSPSPQMRLPPRENTCKYDAVGCAFRYEYPSQFHSHYMPHVHQAHRAEREAIRRRDAEAAEKARNESALLEQGTAIVASYSLLATNLTSDEYPFGIDPCPTICAWCDIVRRLQIMAPEHHRYSRAYLYVFTPDVLSMKRSLEAGDEPLVKVGVTQNLKKRGYRKSVAPRPEWLWFGSRMTDRIEDIEKELRYWFRSDWNADSGEWFHLRGNGEATPAAPGTFGSGAFLRFLEHLRERSVEWEQGAEQSRFI